MTDVISTDAALGAHVRATLRSLAAHMIPEEAGFPSAADEQIFADLLGRLSSRAEMVVDAVTRLDQLAAQSASLPFASLSSDDQARVLEIFGSGPFRQIFQMALLAAYYQDDRVMEAVGLPPRPAWPLGYDIEPTDWSILESVKARGPIWREAPD